MVQIQKNVFISSTWIDLAEYRTAARDVVLAYGYYPVMMEQFNAADETAVDKCKQKVIDSDIFIGIYAHRYGDMPNGSQISITEMEFNWASERNVPRLCFLVDETLNWKPSHIDDEPGKSKLRELKNRIDATIVREKIRSSDELKTGIVLALTELERQSSTTSQETLGQSDKLQIGQYAIENVLKPTAYGKSNPDISAPPKADLILILDAKIEDFDQNSFLESVSIMASIGPNEIEIVQIFEGSVLVQIRLPVDAANALYLKMTGGQVTSPKETNHKRVFVSYRYANEFMAQAVYQNLLRHGYDVFIDYKSIGAGSFGDIILRQIEERTHFLLILTPSALEKCADPNDWLRREIEHAIAYHRNIVPLMFAGVKMGDVTRYLSPTMGVLPQYNALEVPASFFDEAMTRLRQNFLDIPIETIIHPAPLSDTTVVDEIKEEAATVPAPTEKQLMAEQYFEQGYEHTEAGRLDEAISAYSRAINLNPNYFIAYNNRGNAYKKQGAYDAAFADFNKAIAINPNDPTPYNNRGVTYGEIGEYDAANLDFDQAIALDPNDTDAYNNRGTAYNNKGEYDAAITAFNSAIALNPNDAAAYSDRGIAYHRKGADDAAIADFDQAIVVDPDYAIAYNNRGSVFYHKGDYETAIANYESALRIDPQYEDVRINLKKARRLKAKQESSS